MKKLSSLFYSCAWGITYDTISNDVNYKFIEEGDWLYIYFQGSKDITKKHGLIDWIRNFWFFPEWRRPYKDMKHPYKVHGGFLAAWKEVEDVVKEKILEKENDDYKFKKIVIVGYSHGGALSGFCHEFCTYWRRDLAEKGFIVGYGFESPRFFHGFWVPKELKSRWDNYYVIRNSCDIVTHVPFKLMCFSHVGTKIKIGKKSNGLFKDHFPGNVYNALLEHEEEENVK